MKSIFILACGLASALHSVTYAVERSAETATLGAYFHRINPDTGFAAVEDSSWPTEKGAFVSGVAAEGPADMAGLKKADIVVAVNGEKIASPEEVETIMAEVPKGKKISLAIFRPQFSNTRPPKVKWKRKAVRVTPITLSDYFQATLRARKDEVTGHTIVEPKRASGVVNDHTGIAAKVVRITPKQADLLVTIKYVADDWLFVQSVIVQTPSGEATIKPLSMERDNTSTIWEWCTLDISERPDCMAAMKLLQNTDHADLVFIGNQYRKKKELPHQDLMHICLMLDYFRYRLSQDE